MSNTVSIKEQLGFLIQLQEFDTKIYNLLREKEEIPLKIAEFQKKFDDKKTTLTNLEEKAKSLSVKRKEEELDLASKEENVKKLTNQLFSLKTNKEYQTMLEQIAGLKTDASVLEENILKIMEEQDVLKEEVNKEKSYLTEEEKKLQEEKKKFDERIKEIGYTLNELVSKRSQVVPSVDKRIFSNYERILKGKDGLALVKIKDFSCQGCFMNVSPQVVNEIKMEDKIIFCEFCSRILYIEEDF